MAKRTGGRPGRRGRFTAALGLLGAGALGFWLGHGGPQPSAFAQAPAADAPPSSDYAQRVVAYIYGTTPITREDLGEYLIARQGVEKVELLVNKRIIEFACQKRGIEVTEAEVDAAIQQDLEKINVKRAEFVSKILKERGVTLYEYKEDVVKPGLLMMKLCKDRVKVTDEDLQKAFQAAYGPKVECRIIIWPKGEERVAMREYGEIRQSEEGFDRKARSQAEPHLAATGGKIQPIAHNSGVHPEVEQQAFTLKPGEVSRLIATPEGTAVLKCDKLLPANESVKFEEKRDELYKKVYDRKLSQEIPNYFKALRDEAKPVFILKRPATAQDLEREVKEELGLQQTGATAPVKK
jgi:parvulin-like peptidyl-prolyl isomerase